MKWNGKSMTEVHNPHWDPDVVFSSDASGSWGCGAVLEVTLVAVSLEWHVVGQKYCSERALTNSACLRSLGEAVAAQKSASIVW